MIVWDTKIQTTNFFIPPLNFYLLVMQLGANFFRKNHTWFQKCPSGKKMCNCVFVRKYTSKQQKKNCTLFGRVLPNELGVAKVASINFSLMPTPQSGGQLLTYCHFVSCSYQCNLYCKHIQQKQHEATKHIFDCTTALSFLCPDAVNMRSYNLQF